MVDFKDNKNDSIFVFEGVHNTIVNSIRRAILEEVPCFAIEDVEVVKNGSPLYDETVAQRLGLIPLKTDLQSYNLKSECKCNGVGCAMCEVKLNLKQEEPGYVYSGSITSDDPQIIPVDKEIPITKLFNSNVLELNLKAVLGNGNEHIKWAPAHAFLREVENNVELVIEPFGQLDSKVIYNTAIDTLIKKITELEEQF